MPTTLLALTTEPVTGAVLAGGRGQRMGGVDKGLQLFRGQALARHVIDRLTPQVSTLVINANRHLDRYAAWGHPLCRDADETFSGPLAGMLAAMTAATTPWVVCVPCDTPFLPADLVHRLLQAALAQQADLALPSTPGTKGAAQWQTACLLMHARVRQSLAHSLEKGDRKIEVWVRSHRHVVVPFDNAAAFANLNTLDELRALEGHD